MPIVTLLILLVLLGFVGWLLVTYIPMLAPFKTFIVIVLIAIGILLVFSAFGLIPMITSVQVPRVR
jgi:hypothetical protein